MNEIVSKIIDILEKRCLCQLSNSLFVLMQFRCSKDDKVVIVQGRLVGLPTINSSELLGDLQEWVDTGPSMVVNGTQFNITQQCTLIINNLGKTNCVPMVPTTSSKFSIPLAAVIGASVAVAVLFVLSTVCCLISFKLKCMHKGASK